MPSVHRLATLVLVSTWPVLFAKVTQTTLGPKALDVGPPDSFEVFNIIGYAVAVRDVNPNPIFKCLTSRRIHLDTKDGSSTYVWSLNAGQGQPRKHTTMHFSQGLTPATPNLVVDSDTAHPDTVRYLYTHNDCGIMEVHYFGYQCTLWVADSVKDSIPEECLRHQEAICGKSVSLYDKESCNE